MKEPSGKNFVLKVSDGLDVFTELKNFIQAQQQKYLQITNIQGKIRDFEIMITGKNSSHSKKFFSDTHKIINSSGMIENQGERVNAQIHLSLTKDGFSSSGGKLLSAKASEELFIGLKSVEEDKAIKMW